MRKIRRNQLLQMVQTLYDCVDVLDRLIQSNSYDDAFEVLQSSQASAIAIGTTLEEEEKESATEAVSELEAYCEAIYQISLNLENGSFDFSSIYKTIEDQLNNVYRYLEDQVKVIYEIVFLPYKASMWDSMDSVWKAASQDSNCICHVIPIPYYENDSISNTATLKYEGEEISRYVPVTSFNEYKFEERKPDIIYIHNPFDQYNIITSVHPAFYSSELKKYTQMLVYIPYFVTGGATAESFRALPAYENIDKIIVQSQKSIDFYRGSVPENKLVALGSPKVDRLLDLQNRDKNVPLEWNPLIKDKKIVFLNTSITGLLTYGHQALKKMQSIFNLFATRKNEILLWRPHPLAIATLRSMRPDLVEAYSELEQNFIQHRIGIYDTSSDVSLSVAISDAYIGEESSSVVHLFGVMGKPIFLLNLAVIDSNVDMGRNVVGGLNGYLDGECLWYVHSNYNMLCRTNISTGKTDLIGSIPNESEIFECLYYDVVKLSETLLFVPYRARELAIYNLNNQSFKKISMEHVTKNYKEQFSRSIHYKESLYFIPTFHSAIVKYDIKSESFSYYPGIVDELKKYSGQHTSNEPEIMIGACNVNNKLFIASAQSNVVVEFDLDTEDILVHQVGSKENKYYAIEHDGINFWLLQHKSTTIVRWNLFSGKTHEYTSFPEGFKGGSHAFLALICFEKYVLAFPKQSNMIIRIDKSTGTMSEFKPDVPYYEGERQKDYYSWNHNYYFVKKLDYCHVLAFTAYNSSIVIINTETKQSTITKCFIDDKLQIKFDKYNDNIPYAAVENGFVTLENFLNEMENEEVFNAKDQKKAYEAVVDYMDGSSGYRIHKYIYRGTEGDNDESR